MAFVLKNGYDVEHASSLLVYGNLIGEIQHINGKGVTDKYTKSSDIDSVNAIDVMRVLPNAPQMRELGALNNGGWHNEQNEGGYKNAPQSRHFTVAVDLVYDRNVPIYDTQDYSNEINLKQIVLGDIVKTIGLSINMVTFAKQLAAFFSKDNFTIGGATAPELAAAVFEGDKSLAADAEGSYADAFLEANASLSEGIPEIGAFYIPADERQAFVTTQFNRMMKRQYMQNASEAAARILANGFMNPFTNTAVDHINFATGLCGMYDYVDMFIINKTTMAFVYKALGLGGSDVAEKALLDQIQAIIVYGGGTLRGIVGPSIEVNKNPFGRGIIIAPYLKMGVACISGKTIKVVIDGTWTTDNINTLTAKVKFTPVDGKRVSCDDLFPAGTFNDGKSV